MLAHIQRPTLDSKRLASLLLSALLLAGCTTGKPKTEGSTSSGGSNNSGSGGNILRMALTTEPTTFDPAVLQDGTTIDLIQQVFEGLVIWGDDNTIQPNLAEKWDTSPDGKTWTFHLRHGVKFHNGREFVAADFKYSVERACSKAVASTTASSYLKDIVGANEVLKGTASEISGIKIVDPYTVAVTLDAPKPYWLGNMTYPCAYVVCKEEIEKNGKKLSDQNLNTLTGTGPFKISAVQRGTSVSLVAFADYHGGKPKIDGIERPILKDANTRLNKYETGDLDIVPDISPKELDRINASPKLKPDLKSFPLARIWYVSMNSDPANSPFKKKEVRQAFAMAIDKDEAIRIGMQGLADKADGLLPPGVPGRNEAIKPLPFDVAKAKEMLAKGGYPNGQGFPQITFTYRNDYPSVERTSANIAEQIKRNLNIDVQLTPMEWSTFLAERNKKSLLFSHHSWGMDYLDPQNVLSLLLHTDKVTNGVHSTQENSYGYSNPEFDALCDAADVELNQPKRFEMYKKAEQIAIDDAPWIPIYFAKNLLLVRPRVGNLKTSLFGVRPHFVTTLQ